MINAHAVVIGCGGLGSIVAPFLAGAGFGKITLVDSDAPDITNLHRQVFYSERESGTKSQALANHIDKLNSEVEVVVIEQMLTKKNIKSIINNNCIVLECTDDMMTKYLVNDYCHLNGIPMVYGAIYKFDGYVSLFENVSQESIHLRDAFPEPNLEVPSCSDVGVLNTIAGIIGLLQANEAIKYVLEVGQTLSGQLLTYNVLTNDQFKLKLKKNWHQDLESVYSNTSYHSISCINVPEISIEVLRENKVNYNVISILEDEEHESIFDDVVRKPLSIFLTDDFKGVNKPTVFYCMSGKRSSLLVDKLLAGNADLNIYSLKGGLNAAKINKNFNHLIQIKSQKLSVDACYQNVLHESCGGIAVFVGTVRNHNKGEDVTHLDFETYKAMAVKEMSKIAEECQNKFETTKVCIHHREGHVGIKDIAVIIAVSTIHRKSAFLACEYAIDQLKDRVPIWKKEHLENGSYWVNSRP